MRDLIRLIPQYSDDISGRNWHLLNYLHLHQGLNYGSRQSLVDHLITGCSGLIAQRHLGYRQIIIYQLLQRAWSDKRSGDARLIFDLKIANCTAEMRSFG